MDLEECIAKLDGRTKSIFKKNATMAFYNEKEQLYMETDALLLGLGASLLHVKDEM